MEPTLEDTIKLAVEAHGGKLDKAGAPYILHPLTLMLRVEGDQAKMAAVLHDVVEDTDITLADLKGQGFPQPVIEAVDLLTRTHDKESEAEEDAYIERIAANDIARSVKIADLEHNMDIRRLPFLGEEDVARLRKYLSQWRRLTGKEEPEAATP